MAVIPSIPMHLLNQFKEVSFVLGFTLGGTLKYSDDSSMFYAITFSGPKAFEITEINSEEERLMGIQNRPVNQRSSRKPISEPEGRHAARSKLDEKEAGRDEARQPTHTSKTKAEAQPRRTRLFDAALSGIKKNT